MILTGAEPLSQNCRDPPYRTSWPNTISDIGMKHSSSAPPQPPPEQSASSPPTHLSLHSNKSQAYNREKSLPPTPGKKLYPNQEEHPAPTPVNPPPSTVIATTGSSSQSLDPQPYYQPPRFPNQAPPVSQYLSCQKDTILYIGKHQSPSSCTSITHLSHPLFLE